MKDILKKVVLYLGIAILAFIAIIVLCAGFLFFYRDGNIFGFKYISKNEIIYAYADGVDKSSIDTIKINGGDFPINISTNGVVEVISGAMRNKVFGYTRASYASASFKMSYDAELKMITFDIVEPSGWLAKNNSVIEIVFPENYVDKEMQLIISSNKSDINIGGDKELSISDLEITSNKGDVKIFNVSLMGDTIINVGSGDFIIDKTSNGEIDCFISLESGRVGIDNLDGGVTVNNLTILKNKVGEVYCKKASKILTTENIDGGGVLRCDEASFIDFKSKDTDLKIANIVGVDESRIDITGHGAVDIRKATCMLTINGNDGDINLGDIYNKVVLANGQGNITISGASYLVSANTIRGNIKIKFAQSTGDYIEGVSELRCAQIATKDGNIVVDDLQMCDILIDGKGSALLNYNKVVGESTISGGAGSVNIVVPTAPKDDNSNYNVNIILAQNLNVYLKVGVVYYEGWTESVKEFYNIYGNEGSGNNTINIQSGSGLISVKNAD